MVDMMEKSSFDSCLANAWSSMSMYVIWKAEVHSERSLYQMITLVIQMVFYNRRRKPRTGSKAGHK